MHMTGVEVFRVYRIALGFALVLYLITACIHTHFQCINHKITCLQCLVAGRIVPRSKICYQTFKSITHLLKGVIRVCKGLLIYFHIPDTTYVYNTHQDAISLLI